jgi:hypothetical protein
MWWMWSYVFGESKFACSWLWSFLYIIRVIKCRRIRQAGNVAWMVGTEIYAGFWFETLKDRDYLKYTGINASVIFRWAIKK